MTGRHAEAGYIQEHLAITFAMASYRICFLKASKKACNTPPMQRCGTSMRLRYLKATGDRDTLELLLPKLADIVEHHVRGTFWDWSRSGRRFIAPGRRGYQLTWMDAKVGDWVVTPRRGKAVEINALWYNACDCWKAGRELIGDEQAQSMRNWPRVRLNRSIRNFGTRMAAISTMSSRVRRVDSTLHCDRASGFRFHCPTPGSIPFAGNPCSI